MSEEQGQINIKLCAVDEGLLVETAIIVSMRWRGNSTGEASHDLSHSGDAFAGGCVILGLMTQEAINGTYAPAQYVELYPNSCSHCSPVPHKGQEKACPILTSAMK